MIRNAVIVLLVIAVGVFGFVLWSHHIALKEQQRQVQELAAKLEAKAKTTSLELHEKCAKQAGEVFKSDGWAKSGGLLYYGDSRKARASLRLTMLPYSGSSNADSSTASATHTG